MSGQDTLRLDKLTLKNFRCFAECEIELHPELTVLVADNGQGKTALLDAIAVALGLFVHKLDPEHNPIYEVSFVASDARLLRSDNGAMTAQTPVVINAEGFADSKRVSWERSLKHVHHVRATDIKAKKLAEAAERLRTRLATYVASSEGEAPVLPVVVSYATSRLWSEARLTEERRKVGVDLTKAGRTAGYLDCLSPSSSFKTFVVWYEEMMKSMKGNERSVPGASIVTGRAQEDRPESLVAAVDAAVRTVLRPALNGGLGWNFQERKLHVVQESGDVFPVEFLSDGVRTMIGLVADLAHRCVRLNPQFGIEAARRTPGIVLIDEVDMHLHPGWQQTVIGLLKEAFPEIQFVLTTHSPQVLSTVDVDCIRVLHMKGGIASVETPKYQTRGVESADVLAVIMGIDPIPQVPEARMVSEYQALISDGNGESDEGLKLRAKLLEHFGAQHPIMVNCDRLMRFQKYRLRQPTAASGVAER